jgi:hypothetical protein
VFALRISPEGTSDTNFQPTKIACESKPFFYLLPIVQEGKCLPDIEIFPLDAIKPAYLVGSVQPWFCQLDKTGTIGTKTRFQQTTLTAFLESFPGVLTDRFEQAKSGLPGAFHLFAKAFFYQRQKDRTHIQGLPGYAAHRFNRV